MSSQSRRSFLGHMAGGLVASASAPAVLRAEDFLPPTGYDLALEGHVRMEQLTRTLYASTVGRRPTRISGNW